VEKDTTYVALGDSKRKVVVRILRPGDTQPELREIRIGFLNHLFL
jgi:hypothetical protein